MAKIERVPVYSPRGKYKRKRRPLRRAATQKQDQYIRRLMESRSTSIRLDVLPGLTVGEASNLIDWLKRTPTTYQVERLIAIRSALNLTNCQALADMSALQVRDEIARNWRQLVVTFLPDRMGNATFEGGCEWCGKEILIGAPLKRIPFVNYWIHESCGPNPPPPVPEQFTESRTPARDGVVPADFSDFQIEGVSASAKVRSNYGPDELFSKWEWFTSLSEQDQITWCYENRSDGIGWFFSTAKDARNRRLEYEILRPASEVSQVLDEPPSRWRALFRGGRR